VDGEETRERLKASAQRLFALHGIDGVSIKDILAAADARNNASLHYYFGSKEGLIEELLLEGAQAIDADRQTMLSALDNSGRSGDVRAVLEALVLPVLRYSQNAAGRRTYMRFVANMQMNHRALFRASLGDRWNEGYRRCLALLRAALSHLPAPLVEQRLSIMGIYSNALLSALEAASDAAHSPTQFWSGAHTLNNALDTLQAVLKCTPSSQTLTQLPSAAPAAPSAEH
jgi:AcrR family transcriptional regulator